jgi:hypothetical protein
VTVGNGVPSGVVRGVKEIERDAVAVGVAETVAVGLLETVGDGVFETVAVGVRDCDGVGERDRVAVGDGVVEQLRVRDGGPGVGVSGQKDVLIAVRANEAVTVLA